MYACQSIHYMWYTVRPSALQAAQLAAGQGPRGVTQLEFGEGTRRKTLKSIYFFLPLRKELLPHGPANLSYAHGSLAVVMYVLHSFNSFSANTQKRLFIESKC